jgi:hypothetical protein
MVLKANLNNRHRFKKVLINKVLKIMEINIFNNKMVNKILVIKDNNNHRKYYQLQPVI